MTEFEIDDLLSKKLKSCVSGYKLPDNFAARLKSSVCRSRRLLRLYTILAAVLIAVLCMMFGDLVCTQQPDIHEKCAIIADRTKKPAEKVSGWMLLGFFRDCFKRNRNGKRKEED